MRSLENYDSELKKLVEIKEQTDQELYDVKLDRATKYKFLGAALILLRGMEKRQRGQKLRNLFAKWKYNQTVSKVSKIKGVKT